MMLNLSFYFLFYLIVIFKGNVSRHHFIFWEIVVYHMMQALYLQFCIGTIKDDFLGVISDPGATS